MNEIKEISEFPGYYINTKGEIFSKMKGSIRILKTHINKFGYERVILYKNKKPFNFQVHRLVAEAFIPNINNLPIVNHKNENKIDNQVSNLEWCSHKYNINYGNRNKKVSEKMKVYKTNQVGRKIKQIDTITGDIIKVWDSTREIERALGYAHTNICAVCRGKRKTRGGYKWEYA